MASTFALTTIVSLKTRGQLPAVVYVTTYEFPANEVEPKLPVDALLIPVPVQVPPGLAAVRVYGSSA